LRGNPSWDKAAGISFWVKGDGSAHCGGIEFVWNENVYTIFHQAGDDHAQLFTWDKTHLSPEGQRLIANTLLDIIANSGPAR